ncbi:unnamed protein product [marine sediment metagenome]|uniref:Uncharacterized protein n=1 Tax=marine sediment metagenome TaxID=412755 RepID=X1JIT4_9ZZZZ
MSIWNVGLCDLPETYGIIVLIIFTLCVCAIAYMFGKKHERKQHP